MKQSTLLLNQLLNQEENLKIELASTGDARLIDKLNNVRSELKTLRAQILINMSRIGIKREVIKRK